MDLDFILRANPDYVEDLYRQYLRDPSSVGADWAHFFAGFEYGARRAAGHRRSGRASTVGVFDLIHSYRELGHLVADLNPLGNNATEHPLLAPQRVRLRRDRPRPRRPVPDASGATPQALAARADRPAARDLLRHARASSTCTSPTRRSATGCKERMEPSLNQPELSVEDRMHIFSTAGRGDRFRGVPAHEVRRPEALLARGRRVAHPAARHADRGVRRRGRARRSSWACRTAAA